MIQILQTILLALIGQSIYAYIIHIGNGIKNNHLDKKTVTVDSFLRYLNHSSLKIGIISIFFFILISLF